MMVLPARCSPGKKILQKMLSAAGGGDSATYIGFFIDLLDLEERFKHKQNDGDSGDEILQVRNLRQYDDDEEDECEEEEECCLKVQSQYTSQPATMGVVNSRKGVSQGRR